MILASKRKMYKFDSNSSFFWEFDIFVAELIII